MKLNRTWRFLPAIVPMLCVGLSSCGDSPDYEYSINVPTEVRVKSRIDVLFVAGRCLVHIWELDPEYSQTLTRDGFDKAIRQTGTAKLSNDIGAADINPVNGDPSLWFKAPIKALVDEPTSRRGFFAAHNMDNGSLDSSI